MKVFTNLKELLGRLNTEHTLLDALSQTIQNYDFRYDDAVILFK